MFCVSTVVLCPCNVCYVVSRGSEVLAFTWEAIRLTVFDLSYVTKICLKSCSFFLVKYCVFLGLYELSTEV
jgi:hypothetical protein